MRTMLMAVVGPGDGESEPVVIDTDTCSVVTFELDNGTLLHFDRNELVHAAMFVTHLEIGPKAA